MLDADIARIVDYAMNSFGEYYAEIAGSRILNVSLATKIVVGSDNPGDDWIVVLHDGHPVLRISNFLSAKPDVDLVLLNHP